MRNCLFMYFKNTLTEILVINVAFVSWMLMAQFKPTLGGQHSSFQVRSLHVFVFLQDACELVCPPDLQCSVYITDSDHAPKSIKIVPYFKRKSTSEWDGTALFLHRHFRVSRLISAMLTVEQLVHNCALIQLPGNGNVGQIVHHFKCLNNHWMDCQNILYRCSWSPEAKS